MVLEFVVGKLCFFPRGVYLASLLFTDDEKLLVTLDENIPIIEVDDNHPSTFLQDFCWLMKVDVLLFSFSPKTTNVPCKFVNLLKCRGFIECLCRRSVGFYNWVFLVFLMKESKKRRRKQPGKLMAKSRSQPVNLPDTRPVMNPLKMLE